MWKLALAALKAIDPPTTSFYRYFKDKDLCTVKKAFNTVLGPRHWFGPEDMGKYLWCSYDASVFWPEPTFENWCRTRSPQASYFVQIEPERWEKEGGYAEMILCAKLFSGKAGFQLSHDKTDCNTLGDFARLSWFSPGVSILHEFLHWDYYMKARIEHSIDDWNDKAKAKVDPPDGYGPYYAMMLNKNGHEKGAAYNADNYAWFALESYLWQKCQPKLVGGGWEDPPDHEVWNASSAIL
jgi:hypothetical protein